MIDAKFQHARYPGMYDFEVIIAFEVNRYMPTDVVVASCARIEAMKAGVHVAVVHCRMGKDSR